MRALFLDSLLLNLNLRIDMLLTPGCHHQFGTVTLGPLLQLLTGRVEGQSGGTCEHPGCDITLMSLDTCPHHLFQALLISQNGLGVRVVVAAEPLISLSHNLPGLYSTPSSLTSRSFTSSASVTCLASDSLGANEPMGVSIR